MGEIQYFSKWQMIEVAIDEEGFRGALYTASIIRLPLKLSSVKSNGKNKVKSSGSVKWKVFVEYHNLIKEAGDKNSRKPLREYVEISQIRPKPPKCEDYTLEINKRWMLSTMMDGGRGRLSMFWMIHCILCTLTIRQNIEDVNEVTPILQRSTRPLKTNAKSSNLSVSGTEFSELKRCQIEKVSHVPREEHIELLMEQREHFIDHARHMELTSDMRNPLSKKRMQETSSLQAGEQMETISVKRGRLEPPAVDTKSLTEGM
ncbi:hypothetical protein GIB67_013818 [Kingdonia uniflora]|uniref:Agenet-like domain-containing protein n=1 Tax=Kingdonia uniflora TaxID=39325 RepID=A0A7J7MDR1_9MAGN|nr:hypothetical protein GIB67_013818 [Kingdonia uniflora]